MLNILTVDFEEWYHPEYVRHKTAFRREERSSQDLEITLKELEKHSISATFFTIGEIIEKHPEFITQIEKERHEIAFHGYDHQPLHTKTAETLQTEIEKLRDSPAGHCIGFRAPSFSLNNNTKWALDVLEHSQFKYDSSIFPASTPLYGVPRAPTSPYKPSHDDVSQENPKARLWEFPLHVFTTALMRLPMAGGFYLRFFPLRIITRSIKKANKAGNPAVVYVHTWELNRETPKLKLGLYKSFVTYHNLEKTATRLDQLLSKFEFTSIQDYMKETGLA